MKRNLLLLSAIFSFIALKSQLNTTLLSHFPYQDELSDVWGYVDEEGNEYALVGENAAFSVVDVTDPENPVEVYRITGPSSIWRDVKVWDDKAYITNETDEGMLIVDLAPLPQNTNLNAQNYIDGGWSSAHNLYIDENGICYVFGADRGNGGVIMYDLTQDPYNLVEVGTYDNWYVHDGMARGDTLYVGNVNDGFFSIADVSDKENPVILGMQNTSFNFTHNVWVSDDGNYLYTTDEKSSAFIGAYDISDMENIQELDLWQSSPGEGVIPHNTHFMDNYLITSYYTDGLNVLDVTYPYNMVEVAFYDSSPDYDGDGFNGAWGAYPWLPSGNVLVTDIEEGLYVLGVNYVRACYLEGTVTEAGSGVLLNGVNITSTSSDLSTTTGISGFYASGTATSGLYEITYSKPGYISQTITTEMVNGELVIQDVELQMDVNFPFSGSVLNFGANLEGANVYIFNDDFEYELTTDGSGNFDLPVFYEGTYTIISSKWGYKTSCMEMEVTESNNSVEMDLEEGYYDDFSTDLGWEILEAPEFGAWERVEPYGTFVGGAPSAPEDDVSGDCGNKAYVTGDTENDNPGTDDIDDAITVMRSPVMDLTGYSDPYLNYYRWIQSVSFSGGDPNDTLHVYMTNGQDSVLIEYVTYQDQHKGEWYQQSYQLNSLITITSNMRLYVIAGDYPENQLFEAGFDQFQISEGDISSVNEVSSSELKIYPNPITQGQDIFINKFCERISIYSLDGKLIKNQFNSNYISTNELNSGIYVVEVETKEGVFAQKMLIN